MFSVSPRDERLPNKVPVLGIQVGDRARDYPQNAFEPAGKDSAVNETLNGASFTIHWSAEHKSLRMGSEGDSVDRTYAFGFAWAAFNSETEIYQRNSTQTVIL